MRRKVLVVEDDDALRRLYVQRLTTEGFDVLEADSGNAALRELELNHPDVVVLDVYMPGGDGIETMTRLIAARHSTPIILNSAYPSLRNNYLTWVADAFVTKSADLTELVKTVHRFADVASVPA